MRGEGVTHDHGRRLPQDPVRGAIRVPIEAASGGIRSRGVHAREPECRAVGNSDVPAVAVEEDRAIGHRIVQICLGGESGFGQAFVVEPLSDDRPFHTSGPAGDHRLQVLDILG